MLIAVGCRLKPKGITRTIVQSVKFESERNLPQIALTPDFCASLTRSMHRRQQQTRQNCDNRNHHQKLDQRKTFPSYRFQY
jgi:hypothetical protein